MRPLAFDRAAMLRRLAEDPFDVLVIGGGITGVGCALDAASRGLRTALIERDDFASGTSSKSSKLVHGGLRYLQQGDVRLVYEALHERQRLRRNAPHLVSVLPFMIPILTKDGVVSKKIARALGSAMWMYDLTGGWRIGRIHRRLSAADALRHLPTMPTERLAGAYLYFDAATDDARLCLTVARTAADHGAVVANGCAVVAIAKDEHGDAIGADVMADGRRFTVRAKFVVNAAGVWSDDVRALDGGVHPDSIRPAKGIHVTIPWEKVRNDIAVVIPVPKDKRSLFVVPLGPNPDGTFRHTYAGTTDTDYDGPLDDPQCTTADLDYVLRALNASVTTTITRDDITGAWAGLRPLVKAGSLGKTADLSRRHRIVTEASGVISVTGGKLTTYREMAEDTIDVVVARLGRRARCRTKRLRLHGGDGFRDAAPTGTLAAHLGRRFGTAAAEVHALIAGDPSLGAELVPGLPYVQAEAVHAARHEMVRSLDDLLSRRTRARLLDRAATTGAATAVARLVAPELGWDDDETARQVADLLASIQHEIDSEQPARDPREPMMTGPDNPHVPSAPTPPIELLGHDERLAGVRVPVSADVLARLGAVCETSTASDAVADASRDWWPLALHWALAGQVPATAAALCRPTSADQVAAVLQLANDERIPVTPAAGRSGVCGASVPVHGGILLDLTALQGVVSIDATSLVVEVLPGTFGPDYEAHLRERGFTGGHWPQSMDISTVGGWIACRGAGQYSTRYGKIEDMVVGLEVALADGRLIRTGGAPRAAVGPDLSQLFIGAEGTLGVITRAWLRIHPAPVAERRAAFAFGTFEAGLTACRRILHRGATPAVLRLYDGPESARSHGTDGQDCVLLVLDEGDPLIVDATMAVVGEECGTARPLGVDLVERWMQHRNDTSALQDLTRKGFVVDTMEIAAPWAALPRIFDDTRAAMLAVPHSRAATCHLSHSYSDGACLYFTFAATPPPEEIESTYVALWDAGTRAVLGAGGNLSHHHGIGLNRSRFVVEALGPAHAVLGAVKAALDPAGILNPGKLALPSAFGEVPWP